MISIKNQDLNEILEMDEFDFDNEFDDLPGFDVEDNITDLAVPESLIEESKKVTSKDNQDSEETDNKVKKKNKSKNNTKPNSKKKKPDEVNDKKPEVKENVINENMEEPNEASSEELLQLENRITELEEEVKNKETSIYNIQQENDALQAQLSESDNENKTDSELEQEIEELKDLVYEQYGLEKKYKITKIGFIIGILLTVLLGITSILSINSAQNHKIDALYSNISTQSIKESVTLSYLELVAESQMTYEEAFTFINSYPTGERCQDDTKICSLYNEKLSSYDEFITMLTNDPTNMTSIIKNYKLSLLDINDNITNEIQNDNTVKIEDNKLILN